MKLSIIIPVYNEEKTIKKLIAMVRRAKVPGVSKEIIVVNDHSTDSTAKILKRIGGLKIYNHKVNKGKGAAVRTGFSKSTGDILLIQDADLEYDPSDYARLVKPIIKGDSKVVYGSRLKKYPLVFLGKDRTPLPVHLLANKLLTSITNLLYGSSLTDMETCYKVIAREVIQSIKLVSDGFEIEPEITAKILKSGYKIREVSVRVKPRGYEDGKKIGWQDGIKAVYYLFYYRFFD